MKWVALTTLIAAGLVQVPSPVVRVSSGLLRGRLDPGGTFYQYLGVPYGTVDEINRFKAPLPPPTWNGVYDAVEENTWCPQRLFSSSILIGHPDCLKLNIYAPVAASPRNLLPVMVFIHGGCFFEGVGSRFLYGGDYFTDHNVIFVGINYRLNIEGFLCLGIKDAPGNAGLKDQIAAMKWVKSNIKAVGGDPDKVTVFGESAGAVSISALILSPSAKGLFNRAILHSGSTLVPWGIQHDPISTASSLVKEFGYNTKDPYEIYDILSKRSHSELIRAIKYSETKNWITADTLFVPCVENKIEDVEPIITEFPLDIIRSGNYTKMPMIIGYNDKEGIFFVAKDFGTSLKTVNTTDLFKNDLVFPDELEKNMIAEKIHNHYFSSRNHEKAEMVMSMVDLYSDLHFKFPSIVEMEMYARTMEESMYYYLFQYSGYMNVPKFVSNFFGVRGASHADELFYMLRPHALPILQRWFDRTTLERMVTMWTNFAKYGEPTPVTSELLPMKWLPSRDWNPRALVIDHALSIAPMWDERSTRLWNDTYNKYRRKDYGFINTRNSFNGTSKCCDFKVSECNGTSRINLLDTV